MSPVFGGTCGTTCGDEVTSVRLPREQGARVCWRSDRANASFRGKTIEQKSANAYNFVKAVPGASPLPSGSRALRGLRWLCRQSREQGEENTLSPSWGAQQELKSPEGPSFLTVRVGGSCALSYGQTSEGSLFWAGRAVICPRCLAHSLLPLPRPYAAANLHGCY